MDRRENRVRQQEPLTREEAERLQRRQSRITAFHAAGMGVLALAAVAAYRYGDLAWSRSLFLAVILILPLVGGILQLLERCPRCGARLRGKLLVLAPEQCGACGVALPPQLPNPDSR